MRTRVAIAAVLALGLAGSAAAAGAPPAVGPSTGVTATLHQLRPYGALVKLGNFPGGAALTPDGRFLWTVSAGDGPNDVRIVSVRTRRVVQQLKIPGASGGVALDSRNGLAYVSGEPETDIGEYQLAKDAPGHDGDVVHVFRWSASTGRAEPAGVIPVPPPSDAPTTDSFPPSVPPERRSWPERLAVSPDGRTLLVALGLADRAAIVDTRTKAVRYVETGSHPFGAAILPDGRTGLVSNRGPGTVSVIDLAAGTKPADIPAGPHLSHPESITLGPGGTRAYVPLTNDDALAVLDTQQRTVVRRLKVGVAPGPGSAPVDVAVDPRSGRLLVALAHANQIAIVDPRSGDVA